MTDDRPYFQHKLGAIAMIEEYTSIGESEFFSEQLIQDGSIRNLQIIGEAANRLSAGLKHDNPDVPWKKINGMRNIVVHEYLGIKPEMVWDTIQQDSPALKVNVTAILNRLKGTS